MIAEVMNFINLKYEMLPFAAALVLGVITLIFLLLSLRGEPQVSKKKEAKTEDAQDSSASQGPVTPKKNEVENLLAKLKKAKEECQRAVAELEEVKKRQAATDEELKRFKNWVDKDQNLQEEAKKEIFDLKAKLSKKDEEYEREFSANLILKNELNDYKEKLQAEEKANAELTDKVRMLEAQNKGYKEELQNLNRFLSEHKEKEKETEWVSKKEYDALKEQLDRKETAWISRKEYDALKDRLNKIMETDEGKAV